LPKTPGPPLSRNFSKYHTLVDACLEEATNQLAKEPFAPETYHLPIQPCVDVDDGRTSIASHTSLEESFQRFTDVPGSLPDGGISLKSPFGNVSSKSEGWVQSHHLQVEGVTINPHDGGTSLQPTIWTGDKAPTGLTGMNESLRFTHPDISLDPQSTVFTTHPGVESSLQRAGRPPYVFNAEEGPFAFGS
jgi:hypothetical protein